MLLLARCFEKPKNQKRVYGTPPFLRRLVKFLVLTLVLGMFTANILCFADLETTAILVCNISKLIRDAFKKKKTVKFETLAQIS